MASRRRRAILHIGTEKTGSSSIQSSMEAIRDDLPAHGAAYPAAPGARNHTRLALYASMVEGGDASLARFEDRVSGRAAAIERWLPRRLEREIAALPAEVHTLVFSNEHCHSRLHTEDAVRAIKALLDPHVSSYEILVYLRRQDEMAVSRYTTQLRGGSQSESVFALRRARLADYYDYAALLDRWSAVFGRAALRPRIFARGELRDGDVVQDFLAACGLAGVTVPPQKTEQNPALSAEAQEFLRRFNAAYRHRAREVRPREVLACLGRQFSGRGHLPPRAEAEAFLARFAEGNERIRRDFFPDRAALFSTDFSRYPETAEAVPEESVLRVAEAVIAHLEAAPERRGVSRGDLATALESARAVRGAA